MTSLEDWFDANGLPWDEKKAAVLEEDGVHCVELIKKMDREEWDGLFSEEKKITRRAATHVYDDLVKEPFDPRKTVQKDPLDRGGSATAAAKPSPSKRKRCTDNQTISPKLFSNSSRYAALGYVFTRKVNKAKGKRGKTGHTKAATASESPPQANESDDDVAIVESRPAAPAKPSALQFQSGVSLD